MKIHEIFVFYYKDQPLCETVFTGPDAVCPDLYGWIPPRKVYYEATSAKLALTKLPKEIRKECRIVKYIPAEN